MADLQGPKLNIFLTYDMELHQKQRNDKKEDDGGLKIERFYNKDQNFSIAWWPSLKDYYNGYVQNQIDNIKNIAESKEEQPDAKVRSMMQNPCFVIAHELYDALPIHQFEYGED